MNTTRVAALVALAAAMSISTVSEAWTKQAIDARVSSPSCLTSSGQSDFGSIYNGCAQPIHVTMPAEIVKGGNFPGNYGMSVSGNGATTITCHMTVSDFTAVNYVVGPNYNFPSNGNNTYLNVPEPSTPGLTGVQSLNCILPFNSYIFAYSFTGK